MNAMQRYDAARHALAEAHRVDEVKDIRDKALALAAYARQARDREMIEWVTEIKVRAERRLGEMLREQKETVGFNQGGWGNRESCGSNEEPQDRSPTLAEVGIDKKLSMRSQQLAAMPAEHFETAVAVAKEQAGQVTTSSVLHISRLVTQNHDLKEALDKVNENHAEWVRANPRTWAEHLWKPIIEPLEMAMHHLVISSQEPGYAGCPPRYRPVVEKICATFQDALALGAAAER